MEEAMKKLVIGTGMGFPISSEEQIQIFSKVGWDGVFTGWAENDARVESLGRLVEDCGLYYQSIHAPFDKLHRIWEREGEEGEYETDRIIRCINDCSRIGVDLMVCHAIIGMDRHTPTALGLKRFEKIFNAAEQKGITVAMENTEGEEYLEALLDEFGSSRYVRFCIDTGHEMCYNGSRDLIGKYADKLVCTHLNDNLAQTGEKITWLDDAHLLPFDGVADWQRIASRLKAANYQGDYTFEVTSKSKPERNTHDIYKDLDFTAFVTLALEKAKRFAEIMEKA